eukprot:2403093-Amphidinium_carterae.1
MYVAFLFAISRSADSATGPIIRDAGRLRTSRKPANLQRHQIKESPSNRTGPLLTESTVFLELQTGVHSATLETQSDASRQTWIA